MNRALATLALAFALGGAAAADDLVYVFRLADQEIGRETITLTETGWTAKGGFDLMGRAKSDYHASLARAGDGSTTWTMGGTSMGNEIEIESKLVGRHVTTRVARNGQAAPEDAADLPEGAVPVFYADLLWASFLDLGRHLAPRSAAGEIAAGSVVPVIVGGTARTFDLTIDEIARSGGRAGLGGRWSYRITFAGRVEILLVSDETGLPLRIHVPQQKVDVALEG